MKFNDGVSIIVTVFNKEKYIENTLSSVVKQMSHPSELIIVNDGSTDKSLQKINSFLKKKKISHKLINQTNTGPSIKSLFQILSFYFQNHYLTYHS